MSDQTPQAAVRDHIVVKRIIDAPLERVWQAWTDAEQVRQWWGPKHYTSPSAAIDLRVGGKYLFSMRAPVEQGGQESYVAGVYTRIEPLRLLEFGQHLAGPDGAMLDPAQLGMPPDFPPEIRTQVAFKLRKGMTELTITEFDWPPSPMMVYSLAGLHQMIDKLADLISEP